MSKVYEYVTKKIVAELEKGEIPWRKPWVGGPAINWKSKKKYRGVNMFLLPPGEYVTYKQATEAGGFVKKGERGHMVVFYTTLEYDKKGGESKGTGEDGKTRIPYLRYYTVFELSQCEGLERRRRVDGVDHNPIERCEEIVAGYENGPAIEHGAEGASYSVKKDRVAMPDRERFFCMEEYYSTLFHELGHSTGHQTRLNRESLTSATAGFGTSPYAEDELIAEMTAAMLCGEAGIDNVTLENSAGYIDGWRKRLSSDPKLIVRMASKAQKAADLILGVGKEEVLQGSEA